MIAITGYCRTPLLDMLNLTGTLEIIKSLEITIKLTKEERRTAYNRLLNEQGYDERFDALQNCLAKEVFWFYTRQGPLQQLPGQSRPEGDGRLPILRGRVGDARTSDVRLPPFRTTPDRSPGPGSDDE